MKYDQYGVPYATESEACELLYTKPEINLNALLIADPERYNKSVELTYADFPLLRKYTKSDLSIEDFDLEFQTQWLMPEEYKNFDIVKWVLDQCKTDAELQRAGEELLLFHKKNLLNLLQYLKYLVDTMRKNNIVWGVGRGSSVASYVLYLIGVHKINSLYYDLPIEEFLKE